MILVTGGSGFLGRHLVQHLSEQGKNVRALYNSCVPNKYLTSLPGITWQKCDLLDVYAVSEAMQGITDIYHCAAIVTFDPRKREEMLHFNPESTANIVNQAIEQGIRKMVHVSSVAALGRTGDNKKLIDEEQEWGENKYNSAYGLSKYLAENEVWRGVGEGICAAIINPSVIIGGNPMLTTDPEFWNKGSAQLMKVAEKEFPFYTEGVNGWVDVQDVVRAMTLLMDTDIESERYILNSGNHSFKEVFTLMAAALSKKPPRFRAGPVITSIIWRLSLLYSKIAGTNAVITRETASNAQTRSLYNNTKLLNAFPQFRYTSVKDSIENMARSFRQQQKSH